MFMNVLKKAAGRLERVPPGFAKKIFANCVWEGSPDSGILAVTFDDGPDPEVTPAVLDSLDRVGATGTFFLIGSKALEYPDLVKEIVERGHIVGNHTLNHRKLIFAGKNTTLKEIDGTQDILTEICGERPSLFRPPYGIFDFSTIKIAEKLGLLTIVWTVLSGDYNTTGEDELMRNINGFIRPGSIIVFHDTVAGGGEILPEIIGKIAETASFKGIELGGVEEMLAFQPLGELNDGE